MRIQTLSGPKGDVAEYITVDDEKIRHHRLIAVSEFGFEEVKDKIVHHKSEVGWDNRRDNLIPLTQSKHARWHAISETGEEFDKEYLDKITEFSEGIKA